MNIAPQLERTQRMNAAQREIVAHTEGPLLVIAGPGSGKSRSLILRAMNILLLEKAKPSEIVLCTYTEKAAHEMHNRLLSLAKEVAYTGDLSQLRVGTIHSVCNRLIMEHRHLTPLGNDYTTLNEFSQRLFIFQHLHTIDRHGFFRSKWNIQWEASKWLQEYFDKIMEELIDKHTLFHDPRPFQKHLALAYHAYGTLLLKENRVSFAAQLKIAYDLLYNTKVADKILQNIRYVCVDEYQDTNYVQEQIILRLASSTKNLCVVGDEDQALYRFRGATVRNILEFREAMHNYSDYREIRLTINYRSHPDIVKRYDTWMRSTNWTNPEAAKNPFRTEKTIIPDPEKTHPHHPSVICIEEQNIDDEAEQLAELVFFLKEHEIISDYNQVALLLQSVQAHFSNAYREALTTHAIPSFCPRARSYFSQLEVRLLIACFARLFHYSGEVEDNLLDHTEFSKYIRKDCLEVLDISYAPSHPLQALLRTFEQEIIDSAQQEVELDTQNHTQLTDYFYRLLAVEPFVTFVQDEQTMRNLVIFSKVLHTFQNFYHHTYINEQTRTNICFDFFSIFLRLLEDGGINEYEDTEQPFLKGHVQIMTIHQAKGLEFPVVIVGSLNKSHTGAQAVDRELDTFYNRERFEPESRIPGFDMMRLYYVAFSRAANLLVLTSNRQRRPKKDFDTLLHGLPHWPSVQHALLKTPPVEPKKPINIKHHYSFTGHIQMYETCPRQYHYYREYDFAPSRKKEVFLGLLVHQTIEEIHRTVFDDTFATLNDMSIRHIIGKVHQYLLCTHPVPIDAAAIQEKAFTQVYNYFKQNRREIQQAFKIEQEISIEEDEYILTGRIDLLMKRNDQLHLLDFKVGPRPKPDDERLIDYERQLCIYAHALERRYQQRPERLFLYWTEEPLREDALMEIRYRPDVVQQVSHSFARTVQKVQQKDFRITTIPEQHVCRSCDIQHLCLHEGIIQPFLPLKP